MNWKCKPEILAQATDKMEGWEGVNDTELGPEGCQGEGASFH